MINPKPATYQPVPLIEPGHTFTSITDKIGGVVLTVGVLAFFSGSYAFYTVFSPKDATALGERLAHYPTMGVAAGFGIVWALLI